MTRTLTATLAATVVVAGYALTCWALPFRKCWRCHGTGSHPHLITRRMRPCRICRASGLRLRLGRRAFNYFARVHHDATRARTRAARAARTRDRMPL